MEKENKDLMFNAAKTIYEYPGTDENCKAELVKMFPELEPEDERFARIVLDLPFKHEADYKFVKAYLEKQKEHQPAEWSEEDEKHKQAIIDAIQIVMAECGDAESIEKYKDDIDWFENHFKSLCPQPHWKPSEEQMKALKHCVDGWQDSADGRLESLYNDLEKL